MMSRRVGSVEWIDREDVAMAGMQRLRTEHGPALNFTELSGSVQIGEKVLLNCTATDMRLGTGGADIVIARLSPLPKETDKARREEGHIMRLRYTPLQFAEKTVEEIPAYGDYWDQGLDGFPVVVGQLHSQLAPVSAALIRGQCAYVMTDGAALSASVSELLPQLADSGLVSGAMTVGQAFGGMGAVTLHNALLWSRSEMRPGYAFVSQGPGNTGTDTKYGFSGIEQASNLDIVAALGGTPMACVRASEADKRERHRGISHHTKTVLELVRSRCIVPLPEGLEPQTEWLEKHDVRVVPRGKTQPALDLLKEKGIDVTTMGRTMDQDPLFFHAAAAAGVIAAEIAAEQQAE